VGLGGEDGLDVAEFLGQATEEVQNLAWLGDGVADVAQVVGELLELVALVRDGQIPLDNIAELSFEKNGALQFVVAEEALVVRPNGVGRSIGLVDEVEDILGDGCVDPVGDTAVDLLPFSIAIKNGGRGAHMADEAKFAEDRVKKAAPLAVIRLKEIKKNGDMVADVDGLQHGEGGRLRCVEERICGDGSRGGRICRRVRHDGEEAEAGRLGSRCGN
jgi:hypothetical protein